MPPTRLFLLGVETFLSCLHFEVGFQITLIIFKLSQGIGMFLLELFKMSFFFFFCEIHFYFCKEFTERLVLKSAADEFQWQLCTQKALSKQILAAAAAYEMHEMIHKKLLDWMNVFWQREKSTQGPCKTLNSFADLSPVTRDDEKRGE